eukprot:scaffold18378_cov62-Cylindrotheca_fusiformis.AAC.1
MFGVPATVSRVVIAENTARNPDEAFEQHQEWEEVNLILPSSVQEIETSAFHARKKLKTVVRRVLIAENITRIPDKAFQEHQELEEATISSSVQEIGKFAFDGCKKLKFIFHPGLGQEKKLGIPANVR